MKNPIRLSLFSLLLLGHIACGEPRLVIRDSTSDQGNTGSLTDPASTSVDVGSSATDDPAFSPFPESFDVTRMTALGAPYTGRDSVASDPLRLFPSAVNIRITNFGTESSGEDVLRVYFTAASTSPRFPQDWDGSADRRTSGEITAPRWNILDATFASERKDFMAAILPMPEDAFQFSKLRNELADFVNEAATTHRAAWGPRFLPWLRVWLARWEALTQTRLAGAKLPYWDWTQNSPTELASIPGIGPANAGAVILFPGEIAVVRELPSSSRWQDLDLANKAANALLTPDYDAFQASASKIFYTVLQACGGSLARPAEAGHDPLFLLAAARLDRLWAEWQWRHWAKGATFAPMAYGPSQTMNLDDWDASPTTSKSLMPPGIKVTAWDTYPCPGPIDWRVVTPPVYQGQEIRIPKLGSMQSIRVQLPWNPPLSSGKDMDDGHACLLAVVTPPLPKSSVSRNLNVQPSQNPTMGRRNIRVVKPRPPSSSEPGSGSSLTAGKPIVAATPVAAVEERGTASTLIIAGAGPLPGLPLCGGSNYSIKASGGVPPYVFSSLGAMPGTLSIAADGTITGTPPSMDGIVSFTVRVKDAQNNIAGSIVLLGTSDATPATWTPGPLPNIPNPLYGFAWRVIFTSYSMPPGQGLMTGSLPPTFTSQYATENFLCPGVNETTQTLSGVTPSVFSNSNYGFRYRDSVGGTIRVVAADGFVTQPGYLPSTTTPAELLATPERGKEKICIAGTDATLVFGGVDGPWMRSLLFSVASGASYTNPFRVTYQGTLPVGLGIKAEGAGIATQLSENVASPSLQTPNLRVGLTGVPSQLGSFGISLCIEDLATGQSKWESYTIKVVAGPTLLHGTTPLVGHQRMAVSNAENVKMGLPDSTHVEWTWQEVSWPVGQPPLNKTTQMRLLMSPGLWYSWMGNVAPALPSSGMPAGWQTSPRNTVSTPEIIMSNTEARGGGNRTVIPVAIKMGPLPIHPSMAGVFSLACEVPTGAAKPVGVHQWDLIQREKLPDGRWIATGSQRYRFDFRGVQLAATHSQWEFKVAIKANGERETSAAAYAGWNNVGYLATGWTRGPAPFTTDAATAATVLPVPLDPQVDAKTVRTVLFRRSFQGSAVPSLSDLILDGRWNDGIVVWINGFEVFRDNVPGLPSSTVDLNAWAASSAVAGPRRRFVLTSPVALNPVTENVIAITLYRAMPKTFALKLGKDSASGSKKPEASPFQFSGEVASDLGIDPEASTLAIPPEIAANSTAVTSGKLDTKAYLGPRPTTAEMRLRNLSHSPLSWALATTPVALTPAPLGNPLQWDLAPGNDWSEAEVTLRTDQIDVVNRFIYYEGAKAPKPVLTGWETVTLFDTPEKAFENTSLTCDSSCQISLSIRKSDAWNADPILVPLSSLNWRPGQPLPSIHWSAGTYVVTAHIRPTKFLKFEPLTAGPWIFNLKQQPGQEKGWVDVRVDSATAQVLLRWEGPIGKTYYLEESLAGGPWLRKDVLRSPAIFARPPSRNAFYRMMATP